MWRTIRPLLLLGAFGPISALSVAGQDGRNLPAGSVVRFRSSDTTEWVRGTLLRSSGDSLWLRTNGREVVESVGTMDALQIRTGRGTRLREGVLVGLGIGIGTTALFLAAFCGGDSPCGSDELVRAGAIFTLPAVVVGGAIGAAIRVERWETAVGRLSRGPATGWIVGVSLRP